MKFFNLDCHISVIADLKKIFEDLGHSIDSKSISGHNWIFGKNPDQIEVINSNNWWNLDQKLADDFYNTYKEELSEYDGFVLTYPPSFSMLFEKFEKPIIIQIPIRYEVPFHNNQNNWIKFNNFLRKNIDKNIIFPVSNSLYDKKYFEYFVEKDCNYIPNICEYTKSKYDPINKKFLYSSKLDINLGSEFFNKKLLGKYDWQDLANFKGIVLIPYNCSIMSIFEHYTANIPLFVPSINFMLELFKEHKNNGVLSELTWNQVFNLPSGSILFNNKKNDDPNDYNNTENIRRWIELSDFYNQEWMPYITYFDSFDDLKYKIKNTDLDSISNKMEEFNLKRKNLILDKWKDLLNRLSNK
jgi:hypothetical protein